MKPPDQHVSGSVVFDLDKTITRYDTYVRYLLLVIARHPLKALRLPALSIDVLRHKLGKQTNTWLKIRFLDALLAGMHRTELDELATIFSKKVMATGVHTDAIDCIRQHQDNGDELLLLSASMDIYVKTLGKMLGFTHIICTRATWKDDILGNQLDGGNCYGDEKTKRLNKWLTDQTDGCLVTAYGDHLTDFPVLMLAEQGVVVNPDSALKKKAEENHLQHVYWK